MEAPHPQLAKTDSNLFDEDTANDEEADFQREHDRKVDLLITPKNHQRLRAFGFEVIHTGKATLKPSTSDRRSL